MFESLSRSWEFAKASYAVLWNRKRLIVFPILSTAALLVVMASFLIPLHGSGTLQAWSETMADEQATHADRVGMYVATFLFYFCNYFVIVFFNSALVACALRDLEGQEATISAGLALAVKRLPQIIGWALISAVVGVILHALENSHKRVAAVVSMILGMAWSALTYFVVPVIAVDGVGPIEAIKRSARTLRSTWGTALVGQFSLGLLGFLLVLPVIVVMALLFFWLPQDAAGARVMLIGVGVVCVGLCAAASSAAGVIFKAMLFNYATGRTIRDEIDTSRFGDAFLPRQ
jgi:hypothetical protein